jgi:hypothetical protein
MKPPVGVSLPAHFHQAPSSVDMAKLRAERFEKTLKVHILAKGQYWSHNSSQCWLADMLADAMHWSDVNGTDFKFVIKLAGSHHESEKLADLMLTAKPVVSMNASVAH